MPLNKRFFKFRLFVFWIIGFFAFLWVLVRSGFNPKRLSYPCQRVAITLASNWFLALFAFFGGSILLKIFTKITVSVTIIIGLLWFVISLPHYPRAGVKSLNYLPAWEVNNPVSKVFILNSIPQTSGSLAAGNASVPDNYLSDPAIDSLLTILASYDIFLYKTKTHPNGIIGSDNIVIIKCNFQWNSRNTTNTDRIKGLIWRILQHPDGFTGEILICDNTQEIGTGINANDNNSDDPNQSIIDVVNTFKAKGHPVYCLDWNTFWSSVVNEYSTGDMNNGYVYETSTKISYPKFRSPSGKYSVSLRYGIWNADSSSYNSSRLCIINFPVLKSHSLAGATIAVKNWIGVLTTAYANERYGGRNQMHSIYFLGTYALVARVMAVTFPKLTIVDATWTTTLGPSNLTALENTKKLIASTDPVAASWYAAKYILTPIARYPNQTDPDLPGGLYNTTLKNWKNYLCDSTGLSCTSDSSAISVYDKVNSIPVSINDNSETTLPNNFRLHQNYPNPFNSGTTINYELPKSSLVTLKIYNILGQEIKTMINAIEQAGYHSVKWDGKNRMGINVISGVYFYQLKTREFIKTQKMALLK